MQVSLIAKAIIISGAVLLIVGFFLSLVDKIPGISKLPGDIFVIKGNFSFYFPIMTCLVLSVIISIIVNIFFKQ
ncbi:MAG: DUF2905 domain-containing protein [Candidatus Omnitrophica bacterium]|nr:DUF2905 domain-containing protein [Candidatus Omnitrophota bacterium]